MIVILIMRVSPVILTTVILVVLVFVVVVVRMVVRWVILTGIAVVVIVAVVATGIDCAKYNVNGIGSDIGSDIVMASAVIIVVMYF